MLQSDLPQIRTWRRADTAFDNHPESQVQPEFRCRSHEREMMLPIPIAKPATPRRRTAFRKSFCARYRISLST